MSLESVKKEIMSMGEPSNADFMAKLSPGIAREDCLGVRLPNLRTYAKELLKREDDLNAFLGDLPHRYLDENILHGILINAEKDYEKCVAKLVAFLPYINDWAVSDTLGPAVMKRHPEEVLELVKEWAASKEPYTCRVGVLLLMKFYLDEQFQPELPEIAAKIRSDEYYVKMMVAWYMATALAKQWDAAIPYLLESKMDKWTHNKTIQKARESFRITPEQKEYLKTLKRK